jgi:hypothetical protein
MIRGINWNNFPKKIQSPLRGRNDLNAMSRRSSSDLVSLSSFLRSSSAFRLAGLKIGSHLLPFGSHTPFASGGSV